MPVMADPYDFQRYAQRRIAAEKKRVADERGISVAELEGAVIEVLNAGEPDTDKER